VLEAGDGWRNMSDVKHKTAEYYLLDLGLLLKEQARAARIESDKSRRDDFARGRLIAYHEVISIMQQQAVAFDLPLEQVNLHDIDPERDLL
jgi:hypothetical protein